MTRLINMWSGPRNVSTAMMYSWRERPDTTVWDEPMYGHYLVVTGVDHPGRAEILAAVPTDPDVILQEMQFGEVVTPIRFFKNMAHHLNGFDPSIVDSFENFLLTRDPRDMLPSLAVGLGRVPEMRDTGFEFQVDIVERDLARGRDPIVVDSRTLLDDPAAVLSELCGRLDLEWDPVMLSWSAGPKPEDGVWAPHWYTRLHTTTGFEPYSPKPDPFPHELEPLRERCVPLYDRLLEYAVGG
jgi:hypothetical protein